MPVPRHVVSRIKSLLFLTCILLCSRYILIFMNFLTNSFHGNEGDLQTSGIKYILYWMPCWEFADYQIGTGFKPFKNCKYKNCFATDNKNFVPIEQFDALLFHPPTYSRKMDGVPPKRAKHQRYIFVNLDSPIYVTPDLKQFNSFFNWTMTYRFDSDIVRRHGYFFKEDTSYEMPTSEFIRNKTKMAAWFVSNCNTPSKREILAEAIHNQMKVDVYGACGTLKCKRNAAYPKLPDPDCYNMLEKEYKFYFSFEDSFCKDYSTENLYNILLKNIVPIVYGGDNYAVGAPPNSVINIKHFKNITQLVNYLKYLDKNEDEYLKYFEWKKHYRLTKSLEYCACQICEKLNTHTTEKVYQNMENWWFGEYLNVCGLPKIVQDLL